MNFSRQPCPIIGLPGCDLPGLSVVILWQDTPAGFEAMEFYERMVSSLMRSHLLHVQLWSLADPHHTEILDRMTASLAQADLILFAAKKNYKFTARTKSLFDGAIAKRAGRPGGLIGLFGEATVPGLEASPLQIHLKETARMSGLHYFPCRYDLPEPLSRDRPDSGPSWKAIGLPLATSLEMAAIPFEILNG